MALLGLFANIAALCDLQNLDNAFKAVVYDMNWLFTLYH